MFTVMSCHALQVLCDRQHWDPMSKTFVAERSKLMKSGHSCFSDRRPHKGFSNFFAFFHLGGSGADKT